MFVFGSGIIGGSSVIAAENQQDVHGTVRVDDCSKTGGTKKKIVVLGSGWAGISFVKTLDTSLYDVHVISPRNFFVFTPLLPSVTVGTVEARSITEPIRRITKHVKAFFFCSVPLSNNCRIAGLGVTVFLSFLMCRNKTSSLFKQTVLALIPQTEKSYANQLLTRMR